MRKASLAVVAGTVATVGGSLSPEEVLPVDYLAPLATAAP